MIARDLDALACSSGSTSVPAFPTSVARLVQAFDVLARANDNLTTHLSRVCGKYERYGAGLGESTMRSVQSGLAFVTHVPQNSLSSFAQPCCPQSKAPGASRKLFL